MAGRRQQKRVKPHPTARARTLAGFKHETAALLVAGHGMKPVRALRVVSKWSKYVRLRWSQGKPPCAVSDHLARWEQEKVVRPGQGKSRPKRSGGRDADNPKEGEVYETRRGDRWKVKAVHEGRPTMARAGHRAGEAAFVWGKTALKQLREVDEDKHVRVASDPGGKRGKRSKKLTRKSPHKRAPSSIVQSLVFDRKKFDARKAKAWARSHGFRADKVDVAPKTLRLRQVSPKGLRILGSRVFRPGVRAVFAWRKK